MGLKEAIAGFLGRSECEKLIKYDERSLDIGALSAEYSGVKFSLADFKTSIKKVREASEVAMAMDDYQYDICKIASQYGKGDPERKQYNRWRIGALGLFTSLRMTLAALQAAPSDELEMKLESVIQEMHDFVKAIARALAPGGVVAGESTAPPADRPRPRRKKIAVRKPKALGGPGAPPRPASEPWRSFAVAGLSPDDVEEIAAQA